MKLLSFFLALCISFGAFAQKGDDPGDLSKDQQAKIAAWQKDLDQRIEKGFAGNDKLKEEMTSELKNVAAQKDDKTQTAAATAFRNKYLKAYGDVLTKAGVDLNMEVSKLKQFLPGYTVTLVDFQIVAKQETEAQPAQAAAGPKTEKITSFLQESSGGCGMGAGGSVTFPANAIKASGLAVVGGGCDNSGTKSKDVAIGNVNSASIFTKFKGSLSGFATGLVGSSFAKSTAMYLVGTGPVIYFKTATYIAPMLWVAFGSETIDKEFTTSLPKNKTTHIELFAKAYVMAILAPETHANANITNIDVTLKTN